MVAKSEGINSKKIKARLSARKAGFLIPDYLFVALFLNSAILFPMQALTGILPYIQIVLSIVIIGAVLLQRSEASVGGAFGGGDNFSSGFHTRRGFERILFFSTIILSVLFVIASFITLLK